MKLSRYSSQKGFTLVEVLVALFIIALIIMGGGMFFFYGRVNIVREAHRRAAVLVASQRLEELKARLEQLKAAEWEEKALAAIDGVENPTLNHLPEADMITEAQWKPDVSSKDYLEITVTVNWVDSRSNSVSATTLIAPR